MWKGSVSYYYKAQSRRETPKPNLNSLKPNLNSHWLSPLVGPWYIPTHQCDCFRPDPLPPQWETMGIFRNQDTPFTSNTFFTPCRPVWFLWLFGSAFWLPDSVWLCVLPICFALFVLFHNVRLPSKTSRLRTGLQRRIESLLPTSKHHSLQKPDMLLEWSFRLRQIILNEVFWEAVTLPNMYWKNYVSLRGSFLGTVPMVFIRLSKK